MRAADLVTDGLALWVLLAVAAGLALPGPLGLLRPLVLPVLAVMIGAMGLTLSIDAFRRVRAPALARLLGLHLAVVLLAYGAARLLALGPAATLGFVVLGAVTPELTSPVMTHLARGDTALATTVLVLAGLASVATVPGWSALLVGEAVPFDPLAMLSPLLLAVVLPVLAALALRHRFPDPVRRHEDAYPAVSALMVVVVMALVAAANADVVLAAPAGLLPVLAAALVLLVAGFALGWSGAAGLDPAERRASLMSVGMRDFAVAAGVVLAAGLPAEAALPAVLFGVIEMVAAAGLARWLAGRGA